MPIELPDREVLVLRGRLDRSGLFTPRRMRSTPVVKQWPVVEESTVHAELLGDDGEVLHREAAEVTGDPLCEPGDAQTFRVLAYVQLREDASSVRLVRDGRTLWGARIADRPACALSTGRVATRKRTATVGLELSEPGDGAHVVLVYEWGEGRFQVVHTGPPEPRIDVDLGDLPGGERCRFLLTYSNGMRSAQAVGDWFELPRLGPTVTITLPEAGREVVARTPITLEGSAVDRERPRGARARDLTWFVDGEPVGTGLITSVDGLGAGGHAVELRYQPEGADESTAAASVDVRALESAEPVADDWPDWDPLTDPTA